MYSIIGCTTGFVGREPLLMSSCLCKKAEGAIPPFVPLVVSVEDRIDDSVDARDVNEAHHRAGAAANFHKAPLDDVGRAQLSPDVPGKAEEV
jgi:hypothetical protein